MPHLHLFRPQTQKVTAPRRPLDIPKFLNFPLLRTVHPSFIKDLLQLLVRWHLTPFLVTNPCCKRPPQLYAPCLNNVAHLCTDPLGRLLLVSHRLEH